MTDRDLIDLKVESIRRCIARIEEKTPRSVDALERDLDAQDIVTVNLQRAIQLCVDIGSYIISEHGWDAPATMSETFQVLGRHSVIPDDLAERMSRAVGFRNISVHEYDAIDWKIVYHLVTERLDDFRLFARCAFAPGGD